MKSRRQFKIKRVDARCLAQSAFRSRGPADLVAKAAGSEALRYGGSLVESGFEPGIPIEKSRRDLNKASVSSGRYSELVENWTIY
ncbi:hypothetical protein AVEN_50291-1 [Araneus ventricosus]|uniref:Uncharacterized protein n=1 Tax=Araneus ventricosus TaxID=182803 RepID=A0A4Y2N8N0_ARAVE|nr:hypothetical protein AVEN_50291-1 [Araneus ventricosus]